MSLECSLFDYQLYYCQSQYLGFSLLRKLYQFEPMCEWHNPPYIIRIIIIIIDQY